MGAKAVAETDEVAPDARRCSTMACRKARATGPSSAASMSVASPAGVRSVATTEEGGGAARSSALAGTTASGSTNRSGSAPAYSTRSTSRWMPGSSTTSSMRAARSALRRRANQRRV